MLFPAVFFFFISCRGPTDLQIIAQNWIAFYFALNPASQNFFLLTHCSTGIGAQFPACMSNNCLIRADVTEMKCATTITTTNS